MNDPAVTARTRGRVAALRATIDDEQAAEILQIWIDDARAEGMIAGVAQAARDSWSTA